MLLLSRKCLPVFALAAILIAGCAAPAHAATCDPSCSSYVTATISAQAQAYNAFLEAEWFGGLIARTPQATCVRSKESDTAGGYGAQNPVSSASGAYEFLDTTADAVSRGMGAWDLVGVPARLWAPYRQDLAFGWLWGREGGAPWSFECGNATLN